MTETLAETDKQTDRWTDERQRARERKHKEKNKNILRHYLASVHFPSIPVPLKKKIETT